MEEGRANRLIAEKSPYLLQHAHNPVDWYPWGDEAFEKAKREDKPIFLSIGYSTCHWCHVMAHESFENPNTAKVLNEKFVSIKVDREERPDIDEVYMRSVMAMHGQGGWPLTVFLTPDLKPFYGGTYFPPVSRHGLPSFPQLLEFISDVWKTKKEEVVRDSDAMVQGLQQRSDLQAKESLPKSMLNAAYAEIVSSLDEQYGGFSGAPKFPLPTYLEFLLRYFRRSKKEPALRAVKKTLQSMAVGGIHDQLGGGFHRYSTDRVWLVPHFEKMLYDNAQLARVYLETFQVTREQTFLDTALDTLGWMLREMRSAEGGFFSAQDADTSEGEGYYYTWTPAEIQEALSPAAAKFICEFFDVTAEGNFEGGRSVLRVKSPLERVASKNELSLDEARKTLEDSKPRLIAAREKRARPATDDKILSSWNGLAISALALAYQVTSDQRFLDAARQAADFLLKNLVKDGRILRRYRDGEAAFDGALDDFAFVVAALVDLYESTFETAWLREGVKLAKMMTELFWDSQAGGFLSSSGQVILEIKQGYDGPTPSGNAAAALALLRLAALTGDEEFKSQAETTMKVFGNEIESSPFSHTFMLCALDFWHGSREIVVAAGTNPSKEEVLSEIRMRFLPDKVLASSDERVPELDLLTSGKTAIEGKSTVYICQNFACRTPITDLEMLRKSLEA